MTVPEHAYGGSVFDALDTGLILLDGDRRVVGWNAWMASASGIAGAAAHGRRLGELFPDLASARLDTAIEHALEQSSTA